MLRDVKDDITGASWTDLLDEVHRAPTCMEKNNNANNANNTDMARVRGLVVDPLVVWRVPDVRAVRARAA